MRLVTRQQAKARGLKLYFTGKPCLRGHIDERWTVSGLCLQCGRDHVLTRQRANRAEYTERQKQWRYANAERSNAYMRQWAADNRDRSNEFKRRWRLDNPTAHAEAGRQWVKNNPEMHLATAANYRARLAAASGTFTAEGCGGDAEDHDVSRFRDP